MLAIGVVGAGTAGAAAATLLARAGHTVTVFERVADPKPVGAGITLQPTGQVALARLGVLEIVLARAARIDSLRVRRANGKILVDLPYAMVDARLYGLGTHRGVLFQTLLDAVRTTSAKLHFGVGIKRSELAPEGRFLVDERDEKHGPFDLVIAADGSVSELHHAAPLRHDRAYPWGALWFVADDPGLFTDGRVNQFVDRCHTMLGFLPTGMPPDRDVPLISLFWSIRADRVDAWRAAGLAPWRERVLRLEPRAEPILDAITDPKQVLFSRYRDVAMDPWHAERIVFLGDAAHAMSPQLGQGANLALIDAVALADAIAEHGEVAKALVAYSAARRRQLKFYQFMTRVLTPLFQSDSRFFAFVRDLVFPQHTWLRYLRYRMVRTMVGIDRGLLRKPLPVGEILRQLPGGMVDPVASEPRTMR
jgi:2-polyprenyl-6-methoxyphenol hydroxylase-like FAD-dependent oxidoreductase